MFLEALEARSLLATITAGIGPGGLELPSTNVAIWLDGADPAGTGIAPANGTAITTWVDKSGFARNATVASGAPTYVSADAAVNNMGVPWPPTTD